MPNHVESTMKLSFKDEIAKKQFMVDFNSVNNNLCETVMPITNVQSKNEDGTIKTTFALGEHWGNMTMPDGSIVELTEQPWDDKLWGTKWGTYEVDISQDEGKYFTMTFNTAWGPIGEACIRAVIAKYKFVHMEYIYKDECMDFIGAMTYDGDSLSVI